nr:SDR family NAD(P)-dependent oxidoreductase [Chroococcidiopsis sp. CCMEE 29]
MMLENKVALVTGGTSGIGRATAIAMGSAGAKVVFSGRREAKGEETAKLIRDTGAECLFVRSDVSSEAEVQALVEKTIARVFGQPVQPGSTVTVALAVQRNPS